MWATPSSSVSLCNTAAIRPQILLGRFFANASVVLRELFLEPNEVIDDVVLGLALSEPRGDRARSIELEAVDGAGAIATIGLEPPGALMGRHADHVSHGLWPAVVGDGETHPLDRALGTP